MSHTPRLKLPYILSSQAQKEVTHNKALEIIDVLLQPSVIRVGKVTPPAEAKFGDCYIVSDRPEGEWKDRAKTLAYYTNGWDFIAIFAGLTVWAQDIKAFCVFDGVGWFQSSIKKEGTYYLGDENEF